MTQNDEAWEKIFEHLPLFLRDRYVRFRLGECRGEEGSVIQTGPEGGSVHAAAEGKNLRTRSGFILERIVDGEARHLMKIVLGPCYQRCIQ